MALALKRVRGQDLVLVCTIGTNVYTAWKTIKINPKVGTFDATAASATYDQKSLGRVSVTGSVSGFLGTEGTPPVEGDEITVLSLSVSTDEVGPASVDDGTTYGTLRVTSVNYEAQDSPMNFSFDFESGFIA